MKWRLDAGQIEVMDDAVADILREKTPGQRMAMVAENWRFARQWIEGAVRSQHRDWDDEQVSVEVRRRFEHGTN